MAIQSSIAPAFGSSTAQSKPQAGKMQPRFQGLSFLRGKDSKDSAPATETVTFSPQANLVLSYYTPETATQLVSLDYDGTASTDIQGLENFQKQHKNFLLHLNTGRTVEDLAAVGGSLRNLHLYAISTGNGEGLYINEKHLPGDEFVQEIYKSYKKGQVTQDPEWRREVEAATGWDHQRAVDIIQSAVKSGKASPGYGATEFQPQSENVAEETLAKLKAAGIQAEVTVEDGYLYKFAPEGVKKDKPVEFLARRCPKLQSVVVGGDSDNDMSLMRMKNVRQASGVDVPVSKVLMNRKPAFVQQVMELGDPTITLAKSGNSLSSCVESLWQDPAA